MADHPPSYAPTLPQILILPLPEATSFFQGPSVQGEVFVKGLGAGGEADVKSLTIKLGMTGYLPGENEVELYHFPAKTLSVAPAPKSDAASNSGGDFPTSHTFCINLPESFPSPPWNGGEDEGEGPVPGTLNLTSYHKGEIRYTLSATLALTSQPVVNTITIEGTPQSLPPASSSPPYEVSQSDERAGILTRLLLSTDRPRLGQLMHLGVEVKPKERGKTGVAELSSGLDAIGALRRLRRMRVELYRRVTIHPPNKEVQVHTTVLHSSGKSLRYPGANNPPVRLLFTIPTAQTGAVADQTWGEISMKAGWWEVEFGVRVLVGFGDGGVAPAAAGNGVGSSRDGLGDWVIEHPITILPKIWDPPRLTSSPPYGYIPLDGPSRGYWPEQSDSFTSEDLAREAREAYRLKGRDVVGDGGTTRQEPAEEDVPPPFNTGEPESAGPSYYSTGASSQVSAVADLPTFLESEAQMIDGLDELPASSGKKREEREGCLGVGRDGLGGELATWQEYDGYETFSQPPPPLSISLNARGSIDPPQEGEAPLPDGIVGDVVARLGLDTSAREGLVLMERLGLGEGTRVVDLQDDLPPGIDEPSLPALPSFGSQPHRHNQTYRSSTPPQSPPPPHPADGDLPPPHSGVPHDPPSFDASQAASAVGVAATSGPSVVTFTIAGGVAEETARAGGQEDAPPGYDRGGLPPYYSQG